MPYLPEQLRKELDAGAKPENGGQLNYLFTSIIIRYLGNAFSYQEINDILGALEGAKHEFYRRVAAGYEAGKAELNGDVYG